MDTFQYRISLDNDNRLVRIECEGLLGLSTAQKMVKDARSLGVQTNFSLLYDFRQLRMPATVPLAIVATFPLLAGLPHSVPGETVNRLCASGLQAVNSAAHAMKGFIATAARSPDSTARRGAPGSASPPR